MSLSGTEKAALPDARVFESLLKSMGVEKYDPLVIAALEEYACRLTGDLLCDARDYANHRGVAEIDVADARLAIKLSKVCRPNQAPEEAAKREAMELVNRVPLARLMDDKTFAIRYPTDNHPLVKGPDPVTGLLQRTYTLVPGGGGGGGGGGASDADYAKGNDSGLGANAGMRTAGMGSPRDRQRSDGGDAFTAKSLSTPAPASASASTLDIVSPRSLSRPKEVSALVAEGFR